MLKTNKTKYFKQNKNNERVRNYSKEIFISKKIKLNAPLLISKILNIQLLKIHKYLHLDFKRDGEKKQRSKTNRKLFIFPFNISRYYAKKASKERREKKILLPPLIKV